MVGREVAEQFEHRFRDRQAHRDQMLFQALLGDDALEVRQAWADCAAASTDRCWSRTECFPRSRRCGCRTAGSKRSTRLDEFGRGQTFVKRDARFDDASGRSGVDFGIEARLQAELIDVAFQLDGLQHVDDAIQDRRRIACCPRPRNRSNRRRRRIRDCRRATSSRVRRVGRRAAPRLKLQAVEQVVFQIEREEIAVGSGVGDAAAGRRFGNR